MFALSTICTEGRPTSTWFLIVRVSLADARMSNKKKKTIPQVPHGNLAWKDIQERMNKGLLYI